MSNYKKVTGGYNTRKYLSVIVHRVNGKTWDNPLKMSEAYLISQMAQDVETEKLTVTLTVTTSAGYKHIFG